MIAQGISVAFKLSLLQAFAGDEFRIALYTSRANLTRDTATYTPENEVPEFLGTANIDVIRTGYTTGGQILSGFQISREGDVAVLRWASPQWPNSNIAARAALIYNYTRGFSAVAVWDFGKDYVSTNGMFFAEMPEAGLLRF